MAWIDYFRRPTTPDPSASMARDRLSIIVAREGRSKSKANYLPQLRAELLQVLAKYEKIDLDHVTVNVESQGECEVLELNVILNNPAGVRRTGDLARHAPFFSEVKSGRDAQSAR